MQVRSRKTCVAFQGEMTLRDCEPTALPWAGMLMPLRDEEKIGVPQDPRCQAEAEVRQPGNDRSADVLSLDDTTNAPWGLPQVSPGQSAATPWVR
jgi:hypothetical protein